MQAVKASAAQREAVREAPKKPPRLKATIVFNVDEITKAPKTIKWEGVEPKRREGDKKQQQQQKHEAETQKLHTNTPQQQQTRQKHKKQLHFQSPLHAGTPEPAQSTAMERLPTMLYASNAKHDSKNSVIANCNEHSSNSIKSTRATTTEWESEERAATINMSTAEKSAAEATAHPAGTLRRQFKAARRSSAPAHGDGDANNRLAHGCTSLMYACQHGDIAEVLEQLRSKPERIRQRDSHNKNALHYCAAQNAQTRDLVAAASIAIAAPELLESADEDGFTPLHLAVIQGNLAMVNLLLANKADVNAVDNEGHSVVHWATVCGEVEALRSVLAAGANVTTPDMNGGSPLHYAAQMCGASYENKVGQVNSSKLALEILGILLAHPHASVDVQDKDGRQPLLWAASAGSAKAVIALVKAGARVESADKDGLTALHCAASRGHTECIDTLISLCGAPTDLIDSNGCTALHYAVTLGHADATSRLLDLDADPNRQDRKGRTPAHCGCSKGQLETVKMLKERGANLWLRNAKGDLPVHEAASSGRRELVEWLLEQRPKQVNITSNDGRSLLHVAAANDYIDMCKMLLDYGADINAVYRNSKGAVITPLDCALQKGHRSTAKFLQSHGGLLAAKLRLGARRSNPFKEATSDAIRPLKYVEKEELHDLRNSKKYVVYLKHSDSEGGCDNGSNGSCSCAEHTYRKEQRFAHTCRRHQRSRRQQVRRRTSSCGESKAIGRHHDCTDICRSKSNIEIRHHKSHERYGSSSEWEHKDEDEDEDSCENCCYHKRQKQRVMRRRSTSLRRSKERGERDRSSEKESSPEKREKREAESKVREVETSPEKERSTNAETDEKEGLGKEKAKGSAEKEKEKYSRPGSATTIPLPTTEKGATFIMSPPSSARRNKDDESHGVELTDDEEHGNKAAELVTTKVDVHREAEAASLKTSSEGAEEVGEKFAGVDGNERKLSDITQEMKKEVEQVMKIAALAVDSESKNGQAVIVEKTATAAPTDSAAASKEDNTSENVEAVDELKEAAGVTAAPAIVKTPATPMPTPMPSPTPATAIITASTTPAPTLATDAQTSMTAAETSTAAPATPVTPTATSEASKGVSNSVEGGTLTETPTHSLTPTTPTSSTKASEDSKMQPQKDQQANEQERQAQQQQQRDQESRRSFTLLPSDSAEDEEAEQAVRKSSFQILKSDDSVGELDSAPHHEDVEFSDSQVFKIISEPHGRGGGESEISSAEHEEGDEEGEANAEAGAEVGAAGKSPARALKSSDKRRGVTAADGAAMLGVYDCSNGRKRRLKKRVKSGSKTRGSWDAAGDDARAGTSGAHGMGQSSKDQDSGFEPSPRALKSKIPTPRNVYTAHVPRRHIYATLDGRSCSSRLEGRKPGDRGACDMSAVTRSIQRNIRRYYMERKIFQHLLELKSLQIRSNKLNEAVLVKRAVDDYHKSCAALGGETGSRLRRYTFSEYTFKNFELFLYETLKSLQKPGTYNFQNINEVYEEAERRLSPDYNTYEKALQCTTKTHRCLHAAHAYTGIPCAAYIPMMNHHTMPKFGFGPYKKTGVGSFYLPKILTSGSGCGGCGGGGGGGGGKVSLELSHGKNKQLISLPSDKLDSNKRYYVTFTVKESGASAAAGGSAADAASGGSADTADKQPTGGYSGGHEANGN